MLETKHTHKTDQHARPYCGRHIREVMHLRQFAGNVTCPECIEAIDRERAKRAA